MGKLENEVAIVTGGGSGIGAAAAKRFAMEGAAVIVADLNLRAAHSVVADIEAAGGRASAVLANVSNKDDVIKMVASTISEYGRLDVLFNNAGIILPKFIEDIEDAEWQNILAINLTGVFLCVKHSLSELRKTRGKIINMGSMNGLVGQTKNAAYSATKGAVIAMTRSLAIDLAPEGIRVNAVCPAGVITPLFEKWLALHSNPDAMRRASDLSHMLGRTASAEEIASVILFLASSDSSFVTGQAIQVEGGASLGYGSGPKPEWSNFMREE